MDENGDREKKGEEGVSETAASGAIVWDEYHCNPRADAVLVSADMVGFWGDAFYISKKR
jgi:hypothetical protein